VVAAKNQAQQTQAAHRPQKPSKHGFWRANSLSLVCFALFAIFAFAQSVTGLREFNSDQRTHGEPESSYGEYLTDGHFWEALTENWESEFLQMGAYILLTVFLIQKGSAESKDPEKHEAVDHDPRDADKRANVPWPVRRGGIWLRLYENSLFVAFMALFLASIFFHAMSGARSYSAEQTAHGEPAVSTFEYAQTARFWFESFQNWQSEFMAVGAIVVLSIFLRQRGSPESKPVAAAHSDTA
jgi:succinate dehydrogenase hydrophobic anchor subunit